MTPIRHIKCFPDRNTATEISTSCTFSNSIDKVKEAIVETFAYKKDGQTIRYYLDNKSEKVC